MAWEKRERGGSYYYWAVREAGKVRKEYVGAGEIAEAIAHADETMRRQREERRAKARAELGRLEALAAPVLEMDAATAVLARAALVAGGYHRRKGEWRMRRDA